MGKRLHQAMIDATSLHYKRSRQEFQKLDLSPGQPKVLTYLYENEGCPQKELAEQCRVEPATMTVLLRNMAPRGLIRKEAVHISGGKRAFGVYLTESGREMALAVQKIMNDLEEQSYQGFTTEERDMLVALLDKITDNLS